MKAFAMCLLYLALVLTTTGCKALFSSTSLRARTPWQNFDEAQSAYDKVVPHKTTVSELKTMGFDPMTTPNVKILTYLDLIQRFIPNASITFDDLQPDVRACIESKDCCHAYEMDLDLTDNKRFGNLALDLVVKKQYGRLVSIHKGFYDTVPLSSVTSEKKVVAVSKYYNTQRLRPIYQFDGAPLFIMTSD